MHVFGHVCSKQATVIYTSFDKWLLQALKTISEWTHETVRWESTSDCVPWKEAFTATLELQLKSALQNWTEDRKRCLAGWWEVSMSWKDGRDTPGGVNGFRLPLWWFFYCHIGPTTKIRSPQNGLSTMKVRSLLSASLRNHEFSTHIYASTLIWSLLGAAISSVCSHSLTWNQSAIVAVQVGVSLWCVENGGVTVARDLLQVKQSKKKNNNFN